jgi:Cu+-exporting ATPase
VDHFEEITGKELAQIFGQQIQIGSADLLKKLEENNVQQKTSY